MKPNCKEIAAFYESEFKRYTLAIADGSASFIDRGDPATRVLLSDITQRYPELADPLNLIECRPYLDRVIKRLKRQGLWR